MIRIGVIGYGYWGPNLVRNFTACGDTTVAAVCDASSPRLEKVSALYPGVKTTTSSAELIADPGVDAVAIATPVGTHYELALAALQAGKHVLVEKPICSSSDQAARLIDEAEKRGLVLMVDHTFVYTGAVRKMRELIDGPSFGRVRYYDSTRVNLGLFQRDVNVLWDLAVHDLSIMSYIIGDKPEAVSATGHALPGQPEYVAFLTVFFGDIIAHINVNWLSPVKIRRTLIGGTEQMIVYDDLETSEKIKLYDKGITVTETPEDKRKLLISYRTGDLWSPKVAESEALGVEAEHFAACVRGEQVPITGGKAGLDLVRILEAANRSMRENGAPVSL
ncbi:Gfo/Idh/MocA family protein [Allosphingosinicella sp.]|jgi:predicted dehydrogenase|uniref:Gfo/Idh/MocA family protein n=1 Tax=Allosphingosinicella sp. TaxID=2823234 RepID=UPI002EE3B102